MASPPSGNNKPIICCEMCDEDIIAKIANLFGNKYSSKEAKKTNWKDTFFVSLKGKKAVELMQQLKPLMGTRRQQQIERAINSYKVNKRYKLKDENLLEIRNLLLEKQTTHAKIAEKYNVTRPYISKLSKRLL